MNIATLLHHPCRLQVIASSPELYPELLRLGGLAPILALLSHDNSDIAASAIQLLRELTDADAIEDSVSTSAPLLSIYGSLSQRFSCAVRPGKNCSPSRQ